MPAVELVLATQQLDAPGGVQTYLLTIAPQLERLGHEVTLYADELGMMAAHAREHGLRVARHEDELPARCDAVLAQDGATLLALADRYPDALRTLVVHGAEYDLCLPAAVDGLVAVAIVMNSVVERRIRALAHPPQVARLRQPIDTQRFRPIGVARERPERVLLLGNYLGDRELEAMSSACQEAGLDWRQVGRHGDLLVDPLTAIADADIVIGQGRSLLEAMACGRAAWNHGPAAGDGWVTPASYPAFEDDGFRGRATPELHGADAFVQAIGDYHVSMGDQNRRLVMLHHSSYTHAIELVELIAGRVRARPAPDAPLREMARLVRTQHDAQARVAEMARDLRAMHERFELLHAKHDELWEDHGSLNQEAELLRQERAQVAQELDGAKHALEAAERERDRARRELDECREWAAALELRHATLSGSRRWRAVTLAAQPLDRLRQLLRRR